MKNIGKYEVLGLLGRGGMGSVYVVRHPALNTLAALKLLRPSEHMELLLGLDECRRRFTAEARVMAALDHPHVARVWDLDEADGELFFVMEFACANLGEAVGETYRVESPTRPVRPDIALHYARQALDGLAMLHDAGVVHRDVKPFNMLLDTHNTLKLIDFGLSRLRGESDVSQPKQMKVGSPYYTAPEQERDPEAAGPAADLYSMGVLLHRLLTGELPGFRGGEELDAEADPIKTDRLHPDLGEDWDAFFTRALARKPEDRFASAREMAAALDPLERGWRDKMDLACIVPEFSMPERYGEPALPLRSEPIKTGPRNGLESLRLDDHGRPVVYVENRFDPQGGVVEDRATGLAWQRSGSLLPLDWKAAMEYAARLDDDSFGGRRGWRLPTVAELATLMDPKPELGDFCVAPVFDANQRMLWSCDRRTFTEAWRLHAELGYIGSANMLCPLWVRAVCSTDDT